jgi:hypothetical protein
MTGVAKNTITKLLIDLGAACSKCQDEKVRGIQQQRVQCDEIWSFVGSKEKNTTEEKKAEGARRLLDVDGYRRRHEADHQLPPGQPHARHGLRLHA